MLRPAGAVRCAWSSVWSEAFFWRVPPPFGVTAASSGSRCAREVRGSYRSLAFKLTGMPLGGVVMPCIIGESLNVLVAADIVFLHGPACHAFPSGGTGTNKSEFFTARRRCRGLIFWVSPDRLRLSVKHHVVLTSGLAAAGASVRASGSKRVANETSGARTQSMDAADAHRQEGA